LEHAAELVTQISDKGDADRGEEGDHQAVLDQLCLVLIACVPNRAIGEARHCVASDTF
jgi:hypothetical protein